jgi:predicted nucleic acid-binding protein
VSAVVFLETSALLRLLLGEPGGDEVRRKLASAGRILASRLLRVESERALLRAVIEEPTLQASLPSLGRELRAVWPNVDMLEMTREICESAGRIAPGSRLRTLDAIHLATFNRVKEIAPEATMLTFDQRLLEALGD